MTDSRPPLPPNQQLVEKDKWPVVGERFPRSDSSAWRLQVSGKVEHPICWDLETLRGLPQITQAIDIHCVTRWSKPQMRFSGVLLAEVLKRVSPQADARFASFGARSQQNHATSLSLAYLSQVPAMIAFEAEGNALAEAHGGPIRMVVPGKYFYKSVKWLETIEILENDRLGFWEATAGYHNQADPWKEQRFIAPTLSKQQVAKLLKSRNFSECDLMGIEASHVDLGGLVAQDALLRNADFREAKLQNADFSGANLSGAQFQNADLRHARFVNADIEGANFCGADLRATDFSGASVFGVSFISEDGTQFATIDSSTQLDADAVIDLTSLQADFLRSTKRI